MKVSQVLMILISIVIGSTIYFFIKNEEKAKSIIADFENGKLPINEYREYKGENQYGVSNFAFGANHSATIEIYRKKKNKKILQTGGGFSIAILIAFMLVKSYENKNDPKKKLEKLRQKNIISESEYREKVQHFKNFKFEKRTEEIKQREFNKLVTELDYLKGIGIISEDEYQQKLIKIKEKTA